MIKINKSTQNFLASFAKSNEYARLKHELLLPLINEIESVNSTFKLEEGFTAGEKLGGRQLGSKFCRDVVRIIELWNKKETKTVKPDEYK